MVTKTSTSRLKKGYSVLFLALPILAMAQGETFQDDTTDLAAPIDNYVLLAMLIGVYFGYRLLKTDYSIKK